MGEECSMYNRTPWQVLLCAALMILVAGCGVFTSYETARVLPPGHVAPALDFGFGEAARTGGPVMLEYMRPAVRIGIARNFDIGLRPLVFYADVKYQFLRGRMDGALDLGVSYAPTFVAPGDVPGVDYADRFQATGLYPMVLFSGENYFYGARLMCIREVVNDGHWPTSYVILPGVVAGLSLGGRFRFIPEVDAYYLHPRSRYSLPFALGVGFGFQYDFGR